MLISIPSHYHPVCVPSHVKASCTFICNNSTPVKHTDTRAHTTDSTLLIADRRVDSLFHDHSVAIPLPEAVGFGPVSKSYRSFQAKGAFEIDRPSMSDGSSPASASAISSGAESANLTPVMIAHAEPTSVGVTNYPEPRSLKSLELINQKSNSGLSSSQSFKFLRESALLNSHSKFSTSTVLNGIGTPDPKPSSSSVSGNSNTPLAKRPPNVHPIVNLLEHFNRPVAALHSTAATPAPSLNASTVLMQLQGRQSSLTQQLSGGGLSQNGSQNGSEHQTPLVAPQEGPSTPQTAALFPLPSQSHPLQSQPAQSLPNSTQHPQPPHAQFSLPQPQLQTQLSQSHLLQTQPHNPIPLPTLQSPQSSSHSQYSQQQGSQQQMRQTPTVRQDQAILTVKILSMLQQVHSNGQHNSASNLATSGLTHCPSLPPNIAAISPSLLPQPYRQSPQSFKSVHQFSPTVASARSFTRFGAASSIPPANGARIAGYQNASLLDDTIEHRVIGQVDTIRPKSHPTAPFETVKPPRSQKPVRHESDSAGSRNNETNALGIGTKRSNPNDYHNQSSSDVGGKHHDSEEEYDEHDLTYIQQLEMTERAYDAEYLAEQAMKNSKNRPFKKIKRPNQKVKPVNLKRVCMACSTKNSSYWREPWQGACLCNACALRYKKRGVACSKCVYVPFKEDNIQMPCPRCSGEFITYGMGDSDSSYSGPPESPSVSAEHSAAE